MLCQCPPTKTWEKVCFLIFCGIFRGIHKKKEFKDLDVYIITQVFMNFKCEICGKNFRDNYDLNRHSLKKKKCEFKEESNDTSNINIFKQEDLSHINAQKIVEILKKINKEITNTYIRAGKLIAEFQDYINENENNINVILSNSKSISVEVLRMYGWIDEPILEILNELIRIRAEQLLSFKQSIQEINDRVFINKNNMQTWTEIEKFHKYGLEHTGIHGKSTSRLEQNIKVYLTKKHFKKVKEKN